MDGGTHDRRSSITGEFRRSQDLVRFSQGPGFLDCGIQGPAAYPPTLEPAASSADIIGGWPHGGFGIAARRISASNLRTRYAWCGSTRNPVQAALKRDGDLADVVPLPDRRNSALASGQPARWRLYRLCVERKEQHRFGDRHR